MATGVHSAKVHESVNTSSKGSIKPSATLRNKLWCALRDISFSLGCFDIGQMPLRTSFGNQLETKNSVFGQEHVLFEDIHALYSFLSQPCRECVVTMEILFQRTAHDGSITIGRKCAGL